MKHFLFLLVIQGFLTGQLFCQSSQPVRIEIPVRSGTAPFTCLPMGDQGLCLFYPTSNDVGKDSISWSFVVLDKNLQEQWRKLMPLHEDINFLKGLYRNHTLYLLFHDTRKNQQENVIVLMIYPRQQLITIHKSSIPEKTEVADFDLFNEIALIGFNQRKEKPGLIGFSLMDGSKRNFEISTEEDALLLDICVDSLHKDIYAVFKIQPSSGRNILKVNLYNSSSALRNTFSFINEQEKRIINSAEYVPAGEGKGYVAGTYGPGNRNRRNYDYFNDYYNYYYYGSYYRRQINQDNNRDNTPASDGFFTARLDPAGGEFRYYNFIDFNNSQKYINDPNAIRLKHRFDKKNASEGAENPDSKEYTLDYRLLVHPVSYHGGDYIFAAEAYYPEYHTMTQMVYDYYGRAIPSTYSVFDGYRYTNAFLAAFDSSGTMKWNNGIEMRNILTTYLNQKMNLTSDNRDIILYFNANGKLAYKLIRENETVENVAYTQIAPIRPADQFMSEYLGTAENWYGNYFLLTGYETIRNNNLDESKRNVFYISKMALE